LPVDAASRRRRSRRWCRARRPAARRVDRRRSIVIAPRRIGVDRARSRRASGLARAGPIRSARRCLTRRCPARLTGVAVRIRQQVDLDRVDHADRDGPRDGRGGDLHRVRRGGPATRAAHAARPIRPELARVQCPRSRRGPPLTPAERPPHPRRTATFESPSPHGMITRWTCRAHEPKAHNRCMPNASVSLTLFLAATLGSIGCGDDVTEQPAPMHRCNRCPMRRPWSIRASPRCCGPTSPGTAPIGDADGLARCEGMQERRLRGDRQADRAVRLGQHGRQERRR